MIMIKKSLSIFLALSALQLSAHAQKANTSASTSTSLDRPKLVVGMVVDQMRWDFLYRYYDRYSEGGFKRMLREGFTAENTHIPYAQTVTAAGHACVYTGSVPALNGIMGNEWYDRKKKKEVYCVEDPTVEIVGGSPKSGPMSPRNLWATTITDELRVATNFRSKVIGVALKDRGSILPAGHAANAAYWYSSVDGNWITSTYYMKELPEWVKRFNNRKIQDSLYALGWNTLHPIDSYKQSDPDNSVYEGKFGHEAAPVFPHELSSRIGKDYSTISSTPYGNTMTLEMAKTALIHEELGKDAITDFLAVSLSSPDYLGHLMGPNSIEIEDMYLRLDKEFEAFFNFLDKHVGKGQYLFFLTADHGVAHVPGFMQANKLPAGTQTGYNVNDLNKTLEQKFGIARGIVRSANYQMYLNREAYDSAGIDLQQVKSFLIQQLLKADAVAYAFDCAQIAHANLPTEVKEMYYKGYNTHLGGDVQVMLKPGYFGGGKTGTTHGNWHPYDSHIPLVFMGWKVKAGKSTNRNTYMTDIAPTIAAMLRVQMPNAAIGHVIEEVFK